jgi:hypothetical protein
MIGQNEGAQGKGAVDLIRAYELRVFSVVRRRGGAGSVPTRTGLCRLSNDDHVAVLNITRSLVRG